MPGTTESDIDKQVFQLTASKYGTRKHWHQRLPRIGTNTIHPIYEHVPDVVLKEDDIVYVDLGPVFGEIEADFARTYVLGKHHCRFQLHPCAIPLTVQLSGTPCTAVSTYHVCAPIVAVSPTLDAQPNKTEVTRLTILTCTHC